MLKSLLHKVARRLATLFKRDSNTGVFCEYSEIVINTYFEEQLQMVAFEFSHGTPMFTGKTIENFASAYLTLE